MSVTAGMGDLVRLGPLDEAWAVSGAGARLAAVRRAGRALREAIMAAGAARCVRTTDLATFPYPTKYGLQGVAASVAPFVFMRNRMQLVQVPAGGGGAGGSGRTITILVNPTDPVRSSAAPFFARMVERYGKTAAKLLGSIHSTIEAGLASFGVAPEQIDYVTYDHLHVQDARGLLAPGGLLPRAKLLVQRAELATLANLHPLQVEWYIPQCLEGVAADRIVALDGDYLIGAGGCALVRTPGHTMGNHTIVVVTPERGAWTISENGICVDAYAPGCSEIGGLRKYARASGAEVVLNANTREGSLDQYTSMILEKTLADAVPDRPELPQHFASSELVPHVLAPGLAPTITFGAIRSGDVVTASAAQRATA